MKPTNESNAREEMKRILESKMSLKSAREEMERIWKDEPSDYELNLERRVKVLEAQVAELLSEVDALVDLVEIQHETNS